MEENLAIIQPEKLDEIVKQSGLEIQEGEAIKQSYQPFLIQLAEIHEQSPKINWQHPVELDESIARALRLKTVTVRTDSEKLKDKRNQTYLLRANLERAANNLIAATCRVAEDAFFNVEKAREIAAAQRIEELRITRLAELLPLGYTDVGFMNVGKLDDATYNALLSGLKKAQEDRVAEEKRAEEERLAAIKAAEAERQRMIAENKRLQKEAEEKEKALAIERAKVKKEAEEAAERVRVEHQRIAAENEKKLEAQRKEAERLSEIQRKELDRLAELAKEADRKLKVQQELEVKAKRDAEEKAATELRAKQEAEKKATAAPDKEKLQFALSGMIYSCYPGQLKTEAGQNVAQQIQVQLNSFTKWANQLIDEL